MGPEKISSITFPTISNAAAFLLCLRHLPSNIINSFANYFGCVDKVQFRKKLPFLKITTTKLYSLGDKVFEAFPPNRTALKSQIATTPIKSSKFSQVLVFLKKKKFFEEPRSILA